MKRSAQIVAEVLNVLCPHCGEPQPNPDNGADGWSPEEVRTAEGLRTCVSCDEGFMIRTVGKAQVLP